MKYNYILKLFFIALFLLTQQGMAQSVAQKSEAIQIEGLSIYPNPVRNGKVFIVTKHDFEKAIDIYDVLGKKIFSTVLYGRELNLADFKAGVYILKIKETNITATRKLVIR